MYTRDQMPRDENCNPHGEWIHHHDTGEIFSRITYIHGVTHGVVEVYDTRGKVQYYEYVIMGATFIVSSMGGTDISLNL